MADREHGRMPRRSGDDQQVDPPHLGPENRPQVETRGRRRRRSQSTTPESRPSSPISGIHHYIPPTSSFSRSRSNSRSRYRGRRASAYPATPYETPWSFDPRAGRYPTGYASLPPQTPYITQPTSYITQPTPYITQPTPYITQPSYIPPVQSSWSRPQYSGIQPLPVSSHSPPVIIQIPHDQRTYSTYFTPPSSAGSRSRSATAEMRSSLEHHTPYVAVDPFRRTSSPSIIGSGLPMAYDYGDTPVVVYPFRRRRALFKALILDVLASLAEFIFDTVPRQLYLHFLLRLPYFYFSRVARIFEEADMTMPEIKEMAVGNVGQLQHTFVNFPSTVPMGPHMLNLKASWEGFIDSLLREWKTLNIISVLLLSYVLRPLPFFPILIGQTVPFSRFYRFKVRETIP